MAIPRKEFLRELYKLVSTLRVCTECDARKVIKDMSEPCNRCGEVAWRELSEDEFLFEVEVIFAREHNDNDDLRLSEYLRTESNIGKIEGWSAARASILESLEGFSDPQTAQWIAGNSRSDHENVAFIFDDLYTRDFLKRVGSIVDRTMRLSAMAPEATPDSGVNLFLREASRCFIHEFWNSSVALSRAALELGLKLRLKSMLGGFIPTDDDLKLLLEYAQQFRVIDEAGFAMGDQVRKNGNKVLHGSDANEDFALVTLCAVRGVLKVIYAR
jgi:Domain of unknown function (DUF4145)